VLDLDETLVHATLSGNGWNKTWRMKKSDDGGLKMTGQGQDLIFSVEVKVEGRLVVYHVAKRPNVDHFLEKVSEWYKVVIFTASLPEYADPVISFLDPQHRYFHSRYFRDACTPRGSTYMKDLTRVDPDLRNVILVDNSPIAYALHRENGLPVESWMNDVGDEGLLEILPVLDGLRFVKDVRSVLGLRILGTSGSGKVTMVSSGTSSNSSSSSSSNSSSIIVEKA